VAEQGKTPLPAERPVIVVGVNGSPEAERALDWSIEEARLRGASVQIITAWRTPFAAYAGGSHPPPDVTLEDTLRVAAERIAEGAARHAREAAEVPVQTRVVEGHAAEVLIETSRGADLLVVGSPGHQGLWGLSSVSVQCAMHASAPTAISR
jgi:nucleotide-binding universal stress UspA family protein